MTIDITQLPAPKVVEDIDFEALFATRTTRLIAAMPADIRDAVAATLELETEPLTILLQESAYTEMIMRQRINEAAKATLLAYAEKTDLDNRAADYGVIRQLITPADPAAIPPVEAVWEDDTRLRYRCQLAFEGLSVAGPGGAYEFHTLSASADVLHAKVTSPAGGIVRVYILDRRGSGVPDQALLDTVATALSAEKVRPLCDTVEVVAGQPKNFAITAVLEFEEGGVVASGGLTAARERVDKMLKERRQLGALVSLDDIIATIKRPGIRRIRLLSPMADIDCSDGQFPQCTTVDLS